MKKFLFAITAIIFIIILAAANPRPADTAFPPPVLRDPPDFQRFDPETPGQRIKRNREQVDEYRRVPVPETTPKSETGKTEEKGRQDEKPGR